jgi:hypothetical protein
MTRVAWARSLANCIMPTASSDDVRGVPAPGDAIVDNTAVRIAMIASTVIISISVKPR